MVGPKGVAEAHHIDHATLLHQRVRHDKEETMRFLIVIIHHATSEEPVILNAIEMERL